MPRKEKARQTYHSQRAKERGADSTKQIVTRDGLWQLAIVGVFLFAAFVLPRILYPIAAAQNGWC